MATSKAEKLRLLFKDDLAEGQLPKLSVAVEETQEETTPPFEATALTDNTITHTNQELPTSYPSYGEDIEPVGYDSDDENVPAAGSITASGKRKGKKKGKQGPTTTAAHPAAIRTTETSDSSLGPGLQLGELALPGEKFCPVLAVSRYPYRHVGKELSEIVASSYFNAGKFWERTWDMYVSDNTCCPSECSFSLLSRACHSLFINGLFPVHIYWSPLNLVFTPSIATIHSCCLPCWQPSVVPASCGADHLSTATTFILHRR